MDAKHVAVLVSILALTSGVMADTFGTGDNQFDIDFVTISGDNGDLGSWDVVYTFTGVNRDDYRMGTYEITNDQWDKFKASLGVPLTGSWYGYYDNPYWTGTNVPVNMISWFAAAQFINWLNTSTGHHAAYKFTGTQGTNDYTFAVWDVSEASGGTNLYRHKDAFYYLPTEDEWIKAAYWNGSSLQTYATKDGSIPKAGIDSNYDLPSFYTGEGPWNVGSGSEELNGTYDMMGNIWEWMENPHDAYPDPIYGVYSWRALRGGLYFGSSYAITSSERSGEDTDGEYNGSIGLRVASEVPEPATLSLLAISGLALLRRRRRV